ncbi:hypothetical protein PanWU01x14_241580 [Parasponia andersonii]|uniref:Uncharacterized protein n=1 Tax=Parasponia andersonii TaxID=3476 RepID=A0A2P5BGC9_PARAD|nr:hypothetical protein PanWU01x14_241580 [Parasponia andersonii]
MMIKNENQDREEEKEMKATYVDNSNGELNKEIQEEIADMCFMAIKDKVKSLDPNNDGSSDFDNESDEEELPYNKLLDDFNELNDNYKLLVLKINTLKKKLSLLSKELENFSKEKEVILTCDICISLKK